MCFYGISKHGFKGHPRGCCFPYHPYKWGSTRIFAVSWPNYHVNSAWWSEICWISYSWNNSRDGPPIIADLDEKSFCRTHPCFIARRMVSEWFPEFLQFPWNQSSERITSHLDLRTHRLHPAAITGNTWHRSRIIWLLRLVEEFLPDVEAMCSWHFTTARLEPEVAAQWVTVTRHCQPMDQPWPAQEKKDLLLRCSWRFLGNPEAVATPNSRSCPAKVAGRRAWRVMLENQCSHPAPESLEHVSCTAILSNVI